ncbi:MAG: methionine adenosyltransferase [Verrucomicrobia bacterium CG_4_10_14_3_um_filter_43_23]|nr:MAG: methionine adenosyltransferase [Verrucomicrobia bacterium CG1_02_43_26]PIP59515.1 MAG: methionine adenosyltransferase [Verrucomicrobia bacterium CG22_combo_CG10-13_8_21_14_all_43_17]PIX58816.1 MAG: methionine adenosyltransferase [Verrucomicrobia bacterium CG_4_10_14_3_um_filter_43_23]PIY60912.1 MAG: methionine adenosyltransferase [Verrucomicrobia bacterium CG_4_10_14_0_8_um_filter_43_34]PJA44825.1 MAG: methionine adenosyltransferase [Verrucomicrobia bacterium CG_4_9_14_3_um_filter_43_20
MADHFIFSSESVGEGHPDKIADYISDSILDAFLAKDPHSRVACEAIVKYDTVYLVGEISSKAHINYQQVVRQAVRDIGYTHEDDVFNADTIEIHNKLTEQSPEIAQGVNAVGADGKKTAEQGAGDQGIMFGYACDETEELMPSPIVYAHKLNIELARLRKDHTVPWLRPDSKTQVAIEYVNGKPKRIVNVVISTQHEAYIKHKEIEHFLISEVIPNVLPKELLTKDTEYFINPTGSFVKGGPETDAGLTGRKIIADTYGGWARHGGGAFSGKDPSKVDRSAAYMCRWVAKNIVAAGIASQIELQVAYAIGHPNPTSIHVSTFGSSPYRDEDIHDAIKKVFSFKPADIIKQLDLLRPIYRRTTHYGHFTKPDLPWEQTDKVEALNKAMSAYKPRIFAV